MSKNLKHQAIRARSNARRQLLQTLYQWQISKDEPHMVYRNRIVDPRSGDIDQHYFDDAYDYICEHHTELEASYSEYMRRASHLLDPIERAILWIGAYEIHQRPDIHPTVTTNEAIELAKRFGGEDSYKLINATLDKLAKHTAQPISALETVDPLAATNQQMTMSNTDPQSE